MKVNKVEIEVEIFEYEDFFSLLSKHTSSLHFFHFLTLLSFFSSFLFLFFIPPSFPSCRPSSLSPFLISSIHSFLSYLLPLPPSLPPFLPPFLPSSLLPSLPPSLPHLIFFFRYSARQQSLQTLDQRRCFIG